MQSLRGYLACLGLAAGWFIPQTIAAGQYLAPRTTGPDGRPIVHVPQPPDLESVEPTQRELLERLERAEATIESLQQSQGENKADDQPNLQGDASDAKKDAEKSAEKPAAKKESEPEKKKAWYEKLAIRGYAQIRANEILDEEDLRFPAQLVGDSSVGDDQSFLIRRARVIIFGDVHEHLGVYLQPDFAVNISGANEATHFAQIRDWYGDLYLDTTKVHRLRIGQSKVPYGWENMQSSSNRLPLDRNDALNSAVRNERDLGVFYYWTPEPAQKFFKYVVDEGLKGSGNYGVFGLGVYNGQGGSLREQNDNLHLVARVTLPGCLPGGQLYEMSMQGYTGKYVTSTSPISPLGVGAPRSPAAADDGLLDQRMAWTFVYYPQPWGFQTEWNVGRGPTLNETQTAVGVQSLSGGYIQTMYRIENHWGTWFPFARYNHYRGGYKIERNSPYASIDELETGVEWQINPSAELVMMYTVTDRTNTTARTAANVPSYGQFEGSLLRAQFQFNY